MNGGDYSYSGEANLIIFGLTYNNTNILGDLIVTVAPQFDIFDV